MARGWQVARRRRGQENETPEQGGIHAQVTNAFWNRILDMRSESIVMTREDMNAFCRDAVSWFESMRPSDRMGNTVVSQMPRLLRIVINAVHTCQTASTPSQLEAGKQMKRDALDMMSDFVGSLHDTQNRPQFNAQEQGILDKMKRFLWTERSTAEKVAVVGVALLTCAALYKIALGLGMIGGAAATGTAEAVGTTAVAEAAGTAATGTAGAAAAAGTAATGTAITAVVETGGTKAAIAVAMVTMS